MIVLSFLFVSCTARLFCFAMCLVFVLQSTPCRSKERKQLVVYQTESISQFDPFLVYQVKNFFPILPDVSNVITIALFLNKHCHHILSFILKIILNVNTLTLLSSFVLKIMLKVKTVALFLSFVLKIILETVTLFLSFFSMIIIE